MTKKTKRIYKEKHFVPQVSPWPLCVAFCLFGIVVELVAVLHNHQSRATNLFCGIILLSLLIMRWQSDVHAEASLEGRHTKKMQTLITKGFFLFILSEVMFFGALFGSYLYLMSHSTVSLGCIWPPSKTFLIDPMLLPLANACLLLSSGLCGEIAFNALYLGRGRIATYAICCLIFLGCCFLGVQIYEYYTAPFGIDDSIYGSLFFFITGFHGLHVLFGLIFVYFQLVRISRGAVTRNHHVGFDLSLWYWHFVDAIWLIVWFLLYYNIYYPVSL